MSLTSYQKFIHRWQEVVDLPPQDLGPLTPLYKIFAHGVKTHHWLLFVLGSLFIILSIKLIFGVPLTSLTTFLQRGF